MLSINTNLSSLIAQNSLKTSTLKLNTAIERMTTGFKINHAKDNAANYSISNNMSMNISAYQIAEDNTAMGLDLISTASDSLGLIEDKLSRLRSLAEQAANGTYGEQSLNAINAEANSIIDEIERTYKTTEYNGINLLGKPNGSYIQKIEPANTAAATMFSEVDETQTLAKGTYTISTKSDLKKLAQMQNSGKITTGSEFILTDNIDLSGENWTSINNFTSVFNGNGHIISNINASLFKGVSGAEIKNLGLEDVNISSTNSYVGALAATIVDDTRISNCYAKGNVSGAERVGGLIGQSDRNVFIENCYTMTNVKSTGDYAGGLVGYADRGTEIRQCFVNSSVSGKGIVGGIAGILGASSIIEHSYAKGDATGVNSVGGLAGTIDYSTLSSSYALNQLSATASSYGIYGSVGTYSGTIKDCYYLPSSGELNKLISNGTLKKFNLITYSEPVNISLQVGIKADEYSQISIDTSFGLSDMSSLRDIGLYNDDYVSFIDDILSSVTAKQTEYGACQNRLESALDEISTQYENLVSSRSTLRDADIAEVSSEYIRQQILQQASATLLATANQSPALALQLL